MSGCDIDDLPVRGRHRAGADTVSVAAFLFAMLAASVAAVGCAVRSNPLGWLFLAAAAAFGLGAAVAEVRAVNFRLRSLEPPPQAVAGDGRNTGSVTVLRVTDAGGRPLAGRGVERRALMRRLLDARAARIERRTGWATARRARTTPINDE